MLNNKNDYTLNEQGTPISGSFISKATILKSTDQQINREQAANVTDVKDTAILHLGSGRCRRFGPWRWPFLTICVDKICVDRHFFLAVVPFFFALRREPGFLRIRCHRCFSRQRDPSQEFLDLVFFRRLRDNAGDDTANSNGKHDDEASCGDGIHGFFESESGKRRWV